jgi:DNA-binding CsgD family transcriptional regulator
MGSKGGKLKESLLGDNFSKTRAAVDFNVWWKDQHPKEDNTAAGLNDELREIIRLFMYEVLAKSRLSRTQLDCIYLSAADKTQSEIARKLKISQQAVSKSIATGREKISAVRRTLAGIEDNLLIQAQNWWKNKQS